MEWSPLLNIVIIVVIIRLIIVTFVRPTPVGSESFNNPVSGLQIKVEDWTKNSMPVVDGDSADLERYLAAKKRAPGPNDVYASDKSSPNIADHITDPSHFFKVNMPTEPPQPEYVIQTGPKQTIPKQTADSNKWQWNYQNESPMNGGKWGSLMGFDVLDDQFADYGSPNDVFTCKLTGDCNDDIRNGMGTMQKDKIRLNI